VTCKLVPFDTAVPTPIMFGTYGIPEFVLFISGPDMAAGTNAYYNQGSGGFVSPWEAATICFGMAHTYGNQYTHSGGLASSGLFGPGTLDDGAFAFLPYAITRDYALGDMSGGHYVGYWQHPCFLAQYYPNGYPSGANDHFYSAGLGIGDKCQVFVDYFAMPGTTGNQTVNRCGFVDRGAGVAPDLVIFLGCLAYAPAGGGGDTGTSFMLGAADSSGNQWTGNISSYQGSGDTSITGSLGHVTRYGEWREDACISMTPHHGYYGPDVYQQRASIVSMNNTGTGGFTINTTAAGNASNGNAMNVAYIAIKVDPGHGFAKCGIATQGDSSITVGAQPDSMVFFSTQKASSTNDGHAYATLGQTDGTQNLAVWAGTETGTFDSAAPYSYGYYANAKSIHMATRDSHSGPTTPTTIAQAAVTGFTSTGANLSWSTNNGAANRFGWIAMNIDAGDPFIPPVPTTGVPTVNPLTAQAIFQGSITPNEPGGTGRPIISYRYDWNKLPSGSTSSSPVTADGTGLSPVSEPYGPVTLSTGSWQVRIVAIWDQAGTFGGPCPIYGAYVPFGIPISRTIADLGANISDNITAVHTSLFAYTAVVRWKKRM
jgi:hypothetical protein